MGSVRVLICATLSASACCLKKVYDTSTRCGWAGVICCMTTKLISSNAGKIRNRNHRVIGDGGAPPGEGGAVPVAGAGGAGEEERMLRTSRPCGRKTQLSAFATAWLRVV